ncbi:MAG: DUF6020 family protein [Eggerthellaceae bacterium]|nr:DUF6020 family protein [Eggerthellaceae bacterium]
MTARDWVALALIAAVVGTCGVLGVSYVVGQGWRSFDAPTTVALCAAATVLAAVMLLAFDKAFCWLAKRAGDEEAAEPARILSRATPRWSAGSIAKFSLIMALFWLPWLIANYPGGTYWDTYYQIFQCYPENHPIAIIPYAECYDNTLTDAYLCDHHPILVTLIYGAFGMASDALTGNWMAGVFAFVSLQGAAHVVAFTAAVAFLRSRRCPMVLCFAAYAFFCVMPPVSTWAMCMVKDSLFGLFYIPYFLMLFEAVRTRGASLARPRAVVLFALVGLMLCLTKKQGIYVVVPTALVAAWAYREQWRPFAAQALLSAVVMCVLLPALVFPLLNVVPGGKQEVLGTLFQQTARFVTYYPNEVTDEERAAIDKVLEYDNLADQYTFDFQDEVKYRFKLDATTDDIVNYLRVWAAQGLREPECYLASLMSLAGFYVAPTSFLNIRMVTVDTHMGDDDRYMLWNPDELDWLRCGLDEAYQAVGNVPGLDLPLLTVVYVFWLPAGLLFVMRRRRLRGGALFVPPLVLLAFCVIAPVFDARYCVPLVDAAPLFVCAVAVLLREQGGVRVGAKMRARGGASAWRERSGAGAPHEGGYAPALRERDARECGQICADGRGESARADKVRYHRRRTIREKHPRLQTQDGHGGGRYGGNASDAKRASGNGDGAGRASRRHHHGVAV